MRKAYSCSTRPRSSATRQQGGRRAIWSRYRRILRLVPPIGRRVRRPGRRILRDVARIGRGRPAGRPAEDLEEIDRKAHEEIQRIQQAPVRLGAGAARGPDPAVITAARAQATAKCAEVAAAIRKLGTQLGFGGDSQASGRGGKSHAGPPSSDPVDPQLREMMNNGLGGGGGRRPGEMATGLHNIPEDAPPGAGTGEQSGDHRGTGTHNSQGQSSGQGGDPPAEAAGSDGGEGSKVPQAGDGRGTGTHTAEPGGVEGTGTQPQAGDVRRPGPVLCPHIPAGRG